MVAPELVAAASTVYARAAAQASTAQAVPAIINARDEVRAAIAGALENPDHDCPLAKACIAPVRWNGRFPLC